MFDKRVGKSERGEGKSWLLSTANSMNDARQQNLSDMVSGDRCCHRGYESHLRASLKARNKQTRKPEAKKMKREDARRRNSFDRYISELPA